MEKDEILELYRVMVDTVTANEQRRQQISSVFITLMAAGFGAAGAIKSFDLIYATIPAAFVSIIWWSQVRYLKMLASAKFHVIDELEKKLSYQPFKEEWRYLKRTNECDQSWLQKKFRVTLSGLEMSVPLLIFFASVAHVGYQVWNYMSETAIAG